MFNVPRLLTVAVAPLTALLFTTAAIQSGTLPQSEERSIFLEPAIRMQAMQLQRQMLMTAATGQKEQALQQALQIVQLTPASPAAHYNAACLQAVVGKKSEALKSLDKAVQLGFRDVRQIETDKDLESLRNAASFTAILSAARLPWSPDPDDQLLKPAVPGRIRDGVALVAEENTRWNEDLLSLLTTFEAAAKSAGGTPVTTGTSVAEKLVQQWFQEGTAAGHVGDLYDNRDRDHSNLNLKKFPQLVRVEYCAAAKKVNADWGVQIQQMFDRPVLGNSSTAQVGSPFWRSNPRMFMYDDLQTKRAYNLYVNNHLYCYPEHNDYDAKHGDVYPANVPFCVLSQGSSGSDQPFLHALALTMAAFQPGVKQKLAQRGMLTAAVQAIFRRCQKHVHSDEVYLSGVAHPIVFQSSNIDVQRMVTMAHDLQDDSLPPMVQLRVVEEDLGVAGRDYFHPHAAEKLFDTPAAIARVYRTTRATRRMVVDASASRDINGKPLTFTWRLLQGDPEKVRVRPMDSNGTRAEIIFHWHPSFPTVGRADMLCDRIDIGVFAHNGQHYSAPGFVTSFSLRNEKRRYDADGNIMFVDYGDAEISKQYVDPLIDIRKRWRDDYRYSRTGQIIGWVRKHPKQPPEQFNHDGTIILETDHLDRAVRSQPVRYVTRQAGNQPPTLEQQAVDQTMTYQYQSDDDLVGQATLQP